MTTIVPVASGKGGTGKSIVALNLSIALALRRKSVVLVDLDLGGSNLHTLFGLKSGAPGIGDVIFRNEGSLDALLVPTDVNGLRFVSGDSRYPAAAHFDLPVKCRIMSGIRKLDADFVILDLGAGSFHNVVDFFLLARTGFVIATPEPTSMLNAYSFLKTAIYRLLYLGFPPVSRSRSVVRDYMKNIRATTHTSFGELVRMLRAAESGADETAVKSLESMKPSLVVNMAEGTRDTEAGKKLAGIVRGNLGIGCDFAGVVPRSDDVVKSVLHRKPAILLDPTSRFSTAVEQLARKLIAGAYVPSPQLFADDGRMAEGVAEQPEKHDR